MDSGNLWGGGGGGDTKLRGAPREKTLSFYNCEASVQNMNRNKFLVDNHNGNVVVVVHDVCVC